MRPPGREWQAGSMILVFYAFAQELAPFKKRVSNRTALAASGIRGFHGEVAGREMIMVATGVGPRRARETARRAFDTFQNIEIVIGTGVVGALSSGLEPGDIILADRILASGDDCAHPVSSIEIDDSLLREFRRALSTAGIKYSTGPLLTTPRALTTEDKRRAKEHSGAITVDMETAAIAAEAAARGLPFVCMRAVLDAVDDEVFGADLADEHGSINPLRAAAWFVANPRAAMWLPRMMRNLSVSTRSLADALEAIARDIAAR
jgi:adenosylhomocysteine nucleosidase